MMLLLLISVFYPVDSWQNDLIEELLVRGVIKGDAGVTGIRPFDLRGTGLPAEAADDGRRGRLVLPDLAAAADFDSVKTLRLRPALQHDWADFSLLLRPVVKFGRDSLPPYRKFGDLFAGDNERAYVRYDGRYFGAFIGRERFSIGPSPRYNLLLSPSAVPADWLHYYFDLGRVRLSMFFSRLDDIDCKPIEYAGDTVTQTIRARRFIAIRRLDVAAAGWLDLSFAEAALAGGAEQDLSFYYFSPLMLVHTSQYNYGHEANIFFHLDGRVSLPNFAAYAALLVDDFQLEADPNAEPNHFGFNAGAEFAGFPAANAFVRCEYTYLSRYLYRHFFPFQRYKFFEQPLGHPCGPGGDEFFFQPRYRLTRALDLYSAFEFRRQGAATIDSIWPVPEYPRVPGTTFPAGNFLSGTVERSLSAGVGARCFFKRRLAADLLVGLRRHDNYRHVPGATKLYAWARLQLDIIAFAKN